MSFVVLSCFFSYRFNSAVGIEMIDNIQKTEQRFDSMASIGKFGMRKTNSLMFQRSSQQGE